MAYLKNDENFNKQLNIHKLKIVFLLVAQKLNLEVKVAVDKVVPSQSN